MVHYFTCSAKACFAQTVADLRDQLLQASKDLQTSIAASEALQQKDMHQATHELIDSNSQFTKLSRAWFRRLLSSRDTMHLSGASRVMLQQWCDEAALDLAAIARFKKQIKRHLVMTSGSGAALFHCAVEWDASDALDLDDGALKNFIIIFDLHMGVFHMELSIQNDVLECELRKYKLEAFKVTRHAARTTDEVYALAVTLFDFNSRCVESLTMDDFDQRCHSFNHAKYVDKRDNKLKLLVTFQLDTRTKRAVEAVVSK